MTLSTTRIYLLILLAFELIFWLLLTMCCVVWTVSTTAVRALSREAASCFAFRFLSDLIPRPDDEPTAIEVRVSTQLSFFRKQRANVNTKSLVVQSIDKQRGGIRVTSATSSSQMLVSKDMRWPMTLKPQQGCLNRCDKQGEKYRWSELRTGEDGAKRHRKKECHFVLFVRLKERRVSGASFSPSLFLLLLLHFFSLETWFKRPGLTVYRRTTKLVLQLLCSLSKVATILPCQGTKRTKK